MQVALLGRQEFLRLISRAASAAAVPMALAFKYELKLELGAMHLQSAAGIITLRLYLVVYLIRSISLRVGKSLGGLFDADSANNSTN